MFAGLFQLKGNLDFVRLAHSNRTYPEVGFSVFFQKQLFFFNGSNAFGKPNFLISADEKQQIMQKPYRILKFKYFGINH